MELFEQKSRIDWDCPVCYSIIKDEAHIAQETENFKETNIDLCNVTTESVQDDPEVFQCETD
jgi:hypothetical protein